VTYLADDRSHLMCSLVYIASLASGAVAQAEETVHYELMPSVVAVQAGQRIGQPPCHGPLTLLLPALHTECAFVNLQTLRV
jgi:hypothetical protein